MGFAYQIGFVRLENQFPTPNPFEIIDGLLTFTSVQLQIDESAINQYAKRQQTISQHQRKILNYLKLKRFSYEESELLRSFVFEEACRLEQTSTLFLRAEQFLKEQKILRPATSSIERIIGELVIEPKNYPLLLFAASKEKFRQFVEQIVEEDNTIFIQYAYFMDYKLTEEVLQVAGKKSAYRKNIELYIKEYGEVLLRGLSLEERLRGLTEEDLRGLDPETREKLKQLIKNQDEKQS